MPPPRNLLWTSRGPRLFTLASFLFFTGLVAALTLWLTRGDDHSSSEGYFLAGRTLTGGYIAGSLMLTNLSTEQLVGLNGAAFTDGLSVMAWEVVAGGALVLMALWFLPRFLKSGIATIPQFLELRFGPGTRAVATFMFVLAYALILLPIILYTGARGLASMLDVSGLTGIESEQGVIWLTVWVVGVIGSLYAIFGGLRTVAVSDTINGFGLVVGGVAITVFGLLAVSRASGADPGGFSAVMDGLTTLKQAHPEKFNSIGGPDQSVPFSTLFTGVLLLNLFYWCTNQQIIQRTLGARTLAEGQRGVLLAGFLKLLGPLILVLPGVIALHLYVQGQIALPLDLGGNPAADQAYGTLVRFVLPAPMTGFFAAVMVGAILSSFNSALNSTATLFSLGVYQAMLRKNAPHAQVVLSGKLCGGLVALFAMCAAPLLMGQESIFGYLQAMNAIYFIPLFSVVLVGMIDKRASGRAATATLLISLAVMIVGSLVVNDWITARIHNFHFMGLVFLGSAGLLMLLGRIWPRRSAWVQEHSGDVDLTPWRLAIPAALLLLISVLVIYFGLADFDVL